MKVPFTTDPLSVVYKWTKPLQKLASYSTYEKPPYVTVLMQCKSSCISPDKKAEGEGDLIT